MPARDRDSLAFDLLYIACDRTAKGEILQPKEQRGALCCDLLVNLVGQLDDKPRPLAAHRPELEVGEDIAQIALQLIDEAPFVAPLESNFVVSSYQVTHRDRLHPHGPIPRRGHPVRGSQHRYMSISERINQRVARLRQSLEPVDRLARHRIGAGRGAAVLMPIFELDDDLHLVYIRRSDHVDSHRGQVAFPGGRVDPTDETLLHTALREAREEVGIEPKAWTFWAASKEPLRAAARSM